MLLHLGRSNHGKKTLYERKSDRNTLLWVRGGGPDELATGRLMPFLFFVLTGSSAGSLRLRIRARRLLRAEAEEGGVV